MKLKCLIFGCDWKTYELLFTQSETLIKQCCQRCKSERTQSQ